MALTDSLIILKVRKKSYVLFYTGLKRGQKHYDAMAPDGSSVCLNVPYDKAVAQCQLHYVRTTPPPGRRSIVRVQKVELEDCQTYHTGNRADVDKTNLKDYAEYSFDDSDDLLISKYKGNSL